MDTYRAILTLVIFIGIAQGESIISLPEDVTESVGATATFHCEIDFDDNAIMVWERNDKAIYSFYIGAEEYNIMGKKHSVEHNERKFTLTVNNLEFRDGGTYTCRTIKCNAAATLIVLDKPVLSLILTTSSDKAEKCSCLAIFGGPGKRKIPANQFPRLHMYLNGTPLLHYGIIKEPGLEDGREYHRLQQDIKLEPSMEGKTVTCEIRTISPEMSLAAEIPIEIVHRPDPVPTSQPVNDKDGEDGEQNPKEGDGKEVSRHLANSDSVRVWLILLTMAMICFATGFTALIIIILRRWKKKTSSNLNERHNEQDENLFDETYKE